MGATAKTDLQTALTASQSWFAIGLVRVVGGECNLSQAAIIYSEEFAGVTPPPTLEFDYSAGAVATGNFFQLF